MHTIFVILNTLTPHTPSSFLLFNRRLEMQQLLRSARTLRPSHDSIVKEKRAARLLHLSQEHPGVLPRSLLVPRTPLPDPGRARRCRAEEALPARAGICRGAPGLSRGRRSRPNPDPPGLCRRPDSRGELCLGRGASRAPRGRGTAQPPPPDKGAAPRAASAPRVPTRAERGHGGDKDAVPGAPRPPAAHHPGTPGR